MKCISLCIINGSDIQVSVFVWNYWKKETFSQSSNFTNPFDENLWIFQHDWAVWYNTKVTSLLKDYAFRILELWAGHVKHHRKRVVSFQRAAGKTEVILKSGRHDQHCIVTAVFIFLLKTVSALISATAV